MFNQRLIVFIFFLAGLSLIYGQNSTIQATTATTIVNLPSTTPRPNSCQNGGACPNEFLEDGICTNCTCPNGYLGVQCELVLIRLNIEVTFESSNVVGDTDNIVQSIQNDLLTNQLVNINQMLFNNTLTMNIVTHIKRQFSWNDSTIIQSELTVNLTRIFTPEFIATIFGNSNARFIELTVDIDECVSLWSDCDENARCVNRVNGFNCLCLRGFTGNGRTCTEIVCNLASAPSTPSLSTRTIAYENGTIIENPGSILPFGVTIEFSCQRNYNLVETVTGNPSTLVIECTGTSPRYQNSNWSGTDVTCSIDRSFGIAIALSVLSCILIFLVIGCFCVNHCVKRERKLKANREEEDMAFETSVLEGQ